ncbi:hypothetical protein VNO80_14829 [Phaseolus coccineus]|uniref:Ethylene-insensitive protein 2 n=1 Tax=Phaseolus coccineus TaxID=3886 RepID=A0AAN9MMI5_PHACN
MEAETLNVNHPPSFLHRSLPAVVPTLLISIGYVDPGKWVAIVEGGARFGFDLMAFALIFNFAAIFCQYISAKIGVITGKDLAQICSDEYDSWTCMLLGVQAELSVIVLDLNLILGMAHGLNIVFGWDLFACVFLTATGAVFHLLLFVLLDIEKAKIVGLFVSGFVFLTFVLGTLINQPDIPLSVNGILTKLSGESAFVLMSLLGATLVPHNFYLHSSIVQWHQGSTTISKDALCHNHFLAIICVFSGLYLVNNVLMNAGANEFYSMGLVLTTFQDALSPMEQVLRSPMAMLVFLLILFFANQTTALTWSFGGEVVVHSFLKLDIPGWLHYATIRVIAVLPALYCVWSSGAEGMYQLLIFTQIVVALQLPSSVIPLFRIASSRSIMGVHKIPQFVEFLALIIFIGMLVLNIVFVVEMIFGSSDWVGNLRWNVGNGVSLSYLVLLCTAFASFCLMLWLAATPLKSASIQLDEAWNWDMPQAMPEPRIDSEETDLSETSYHGDASVQEMEPSPALTRTLEYSELPVASFLHELPETILEPDVPVITVRETHSFTSFPCSPTPVVKESISTSESEAVAAASTETSGIRLVDAKTLKTETSASVEKTLEVEGDSNAERDDDDGDLWETEEISKVVSLAPSSAPDGPASFRSLSGKSDDGGNSLGSLSRLAGLGRGARRQLAAILDEFWGQLYDFHGLFTQEAKAKKLDVLLGVDSRLTDSLQKMDTCGREYPGHWIAGSLPDSLINSASYDSLKQHRMRNNFEPSYGPRRRTNPMQVMDEYVQTSNRNLLSAGERPYSSVRNLPTSRSWDYQPTTVHGYQVASYINQVGKETNSDNLNGLMESPSMGIMSNYRNSIGNTNNNYRNSIALARGQKLQNGSGLSQPPGFQNIAVPKNCQLPSERSCYGPADNSVSSVNAKKYHSLPDISGYAIPHRDAYISDKSALWDGSVGGYRYSTGRTHHEQSLYSNSGSRAGAPLAFDVLSPSEVYNNVLSSQLSSGLGTGSLWSRQPFEQFGVDDRVHNASTEDVGNRPSAITHETTSVVDIDGKLLQSFRSCILKLLKLEGSDWLFKQNDGADEDLIDRVAAREKFFSEVETTEMNQANAMGEARYFSSDGKPFSSMKNNEANWSNFSVISIPNCGEGCVWRADIIISFGVWCIHRVLDLSLMESRPELWGKYTYVLNRLQGIIDLAFFKPRCPMTACFCLQVPMTYQIKSSSPPSNGMLPPASKPGRGKCTTGSVVFEMVKDVEIAISSRKGRTGTAAGDVAFPKGKENLASVLKRYKRRLSIKPVGTQEGIRKIPTSAPYNS